MTGSRFSYFCSSCNVIFSVGSRKIFSNSILIVELYRLYHKDQKLDSLCILNHLLVVLINLFFQLSFLFLLKEKDLFLWLLFYFLLLGIVFLSNVIMEFI